MTARFFKTAAAIVLSVLLCACSFSHTQEGQFTVPTTEAPPGDGGPTYIDALSKLDIPDAITARGIDESVPYSVLDGLDKLLGVGRGAAQYDFYELSAKDLSDLADALYTCELINAFPPDDTNAVTDYLLQEVPEVFSGRTAYSAAVKVMTRRGFNDAVDMILPEPHMFLGFEFPTIETADFSSGVANVVVYVPGYDCVAVFSKTAAPTNTRPLYYIVNAVIDGEKLLVTAVRTEEDTMTAVNAGVYDVHSKTFFERQAIIAGLINNAIADGRIAQATMEIVKSEFTLIRGEYRLERSATVYGVLELRDAEVPVLEEEESTEAS